MEKSYKEYLENITTFVFDIDGVLTDGIVHITTSGEMLRTMNVKDGYALKTALKKGYKICIISGGANEGVRSRLEGLGVTDIYLGAHLKKEPLEDFLKKHAINLSNVLYMGDDMPDVPVMKMVGLAACPQDAVPEVKNVANYISHKDGGKGCVRDIIEQVLKVRNNWNDNYSAGND